MIRSTRHPHRARSVLTLCAAIGAMFVVSAAAEGGLIAHLRFDDPSGSTVASDSVDGHHGALKNMDPSTDWVAGKINGALDFDGNNDYVLVDDHAALDFGSGDFSVSYWVNKRQKTTGYENIWGVNKWNTGGSPGTNEWTIGIGGQNNDRPVFAIEEDDSPTYSRYIARSPDAISLNAWHHLVGVRRGGSLLLYVDGDLKDSDHTLGSAAVNNAGRDLYIAGAASPGNRPLARFDDLQIYDFALTEAQVAQLFNGPGSTIPEPATFLVWSLLTGAAIGFGYYRKRSASA